MSTYTQIYYHIVFSTKYRAPVLQHRGRERLFEYIGAIIGRRRCRLYLMNGTLDHVHILSSLHPSVSLSDLVKDIKAVSSHWIKTCNLYPAFSNWQEGYGAFTHSQSDQDRLIEYIKRQEQHHEEVSFAEEMRALIVEAGMKFDDRYFLPDEP